MGSPERTRVDFNAPTSIVERADALADLLGISRTQLIIDALDDKMSDVADNEEFNRRIRDAYYSDQIGFADIEALLGTEEAIRSKLLKDSLDRDPPVPKLAGELPSDEEFYDGNLPEFISDETHGSSVQSP